MQKRNNNLVYGERDKKAIKKREKVHFIYKSFRKLGRILSNYNQKQIKSISIYPIINSKEELIEIANKLAWALPYKKDLKIYIPVSKNLLNFDLKKVDNIKNQRNYLKTNISHIILTEKFKNNVDLILITKAKSIFKLNPLKLYKTEIIDKLYFSTIEGGVLQNIYYNTLSEKEKEEIEKLSLENFKNFLEEKKGKKKAYCFVTGPSFDKYKNFSFEENSLKVICNSIVKNEEFLNYIKGPDLLVFADPVFHFSPSEYSAVFRDKVLEVYRKYKPYIFVPEKTLALLLAHYPELKKHIIGMKTYGKEFNFPSPEKFYVKGTANILTLFMLPIASSISDEVYILGADGRNPNEKYFWQHSKSAQFSDLMQTVFETHPSFFRDRDYKDYYEEHCKILNDLIEYGENLGKKYYSLTKSYIPALAKRLLNSR